MKTHEMLIYFEVRGNHTHLSVFAGKVGNQRAHLGVLIMRNDEFEAWANGEMAIVFKPKE